MFKRGIRYFLGNASGQDICFAQVQDLLPSIAEDLGLNFDAASPRRAATTRQPRHNEYTDKDFDDILEALYAKVCSENDIQKKMSYLSDISKLVFHLTTDIRLKVTTFAREIDDKAQDVENNETQENVEQSESQEVAEVTPGEEQAEDEKTEEIATVEEPVKEEPKEVSLADSIIAMLDSTGFSSISFGGFDFTKKKSWMLGRKKIENLDEETLEAIKASEGLVQVEIEDTLIEEYADCLEEKQEEPVASETTEEAKEEVVTEETKEDVIKDIERLLRESGKDGVDIENRTRFISGKVVAEATAVFFKKDVLNIHVVCAEGYAMGQERDVKADYKFVTLEYLKSIRDEIKDQL